jgi:hypothetical protein
VELLLCNCAQLQQVESEVEGTALSSTNLLTGVGASTETGLLHARHFLLGPTQSAGQPHVRPLDSAKTSRATNRGDCIPSLTLGKRRDVISFSPSHQANKSPFLNCFTSWPSAPRGFVTYLNSFITLPRATAASKRSNRRKVRNVPKLAVITHEPT